MDNLIQMKPRYVQNIINKFCYSIGMIPTSYKIALTYEEQILAIGQYLENTVYPAINNNAEALKELQDLYLELKEMIDNLDLQDEVNHKIDELVESGALAELINQELLTEIQKINSTSDIYFISPQDKTIDFGDCCVIKGTKNIIVDLGFETNAQTLLAFLLNNNITKIDYIIISHYHQDHIGGLNAEGLDTLLSNNGLDFSECKVLLPHRGINYNLFVPNGNTIISSVEQTVISILNNHNVEFYYPAENETIKLSDTEELEFFNLSEEFYNKYYNITKDSSYNDSENTNYNNFSMVVLYKHTNNYMLFTGDIEFDAQKNIYNSINKCDLIKIEHHGSNRLSYQKYLEQLNPKFGIVCTRLAQLTDYNSPTIYNIKSKNAKLYSTYNNDVIHFVSLYNDLICINCTEYMLQNTNLLNTQGQALYVGANLNDYTTPR